MSRVAVLTDSNSGITQAAGKELGVGILPMPFFIDGEEYFEEITLSQKEFYERLKANHDVKTSQPAPGDVMGMWDKYLEEYDEVVYIPMSSGLSSSCETAIMLSTDYDGKVQVVNNQRISVTQRQSVLDALKLRDAGKNAAEIKEILEKVKLVLNLKPVLQIQGEKLDAYAKVRGWKQAKKTMLDAIEKDMLHRFGKQPVHLEAAYTCSEEEARKWKEEIEDRFPEYEVDMDPLSLSVACHIGPGAMAVACSKVLTV